MANVSFIEKLRGLELVVTPSRNGHLATFSLGPICLPDKPDLTPEIVISGLEWKPGRDDIIVATFPKCGTTWMQYIVLNLVRFGEDLIGKSIQELSPFLEFDGTSDFHSIPTPRVVKTHLYHPFTPHHPDTKYIYVVRNPKDAAVSFWHHVRGHCSQLADLEWSDFFDCWIRGEVPAGDYFEHLKSWLPHCRDRNVLLVKYEALLADTEGEVKRVGEFLGGNAAEVVRDSECLATVLHNTSFQEMKRRNDTAGLYRMPWSEGRPGFFRSGKSGTWRDVMTEDQSRQIDARMEFVLGGTEVMLWWPEELKF